MRAGGITRLRAVQSRLPETVRDAVSTDVRRLPPAIVTEGSRHETLSTAADASAQLTSREGRRLTYDVVVDGDAI